MGETILLRNANFVRQGAGLVLADVLSVLFKVCEFLPLARRESKQLPKFLDKKKAIVNVPNNFIRSFGINTPLHASPS